MPGGAVGCSTAPAEQLTLAANTMLSSNDVENE
jgi:hypothetical protein